MRIHKNIEKTIETEILVAVKCDICGKEITGKFWQLTTHHHDWGNDSIDSYEYKDLCSRECINKALDDYIKNCAVSDTQCFELEQDSLRVKAEGEEGE